ncbi:MAG: hypothetical protein ACK55Z_23950, partial [bacterium]
DRPFGTDRRQRQEGDDKKIHRRLRQRCQRNHNYDRTGRAELVQPAFQGKLQQSHRGFRELAQDDSWRSRAAESQDRRAGIRPRAKRAAA